MRHGLLAGVALALLLVGGASAKGPLPPEASYFAIDGSRIVFPSGDAEHPCEVTVRDLATGRDVKFRPDTVTEKACNTDQAGLLVQPVNRERALLVECPCLAIAGTRI